MKSVITLGIAIVLLAACTPKTTVQNDFEGRFITVSGHDLVKPDGSIPKDICSALAKHRPIVSSTRCFAN